MTQKSTTFSTLFDLIHPTWKHINRQGVSAYWKNSNFTFFDFAFDPLGAALNSTTAQPTGMGFVSTPGHTILPSSGNGRS
jgi:hypothetical protein